MVQREPSFGGSVLRWMVRCAGRALGRRGVGVTQGGVGGAGAESSFEVLEGRQLMAAVSWDGGGDGVLWSDARNWSGDVLPGPTSDVTINVAANPVINFTSTAGTIGIASLTLAETLVINGGSLTVLNTASVVTGGGIALAGGSIAGGTWNLGASVLSVSGQTGEIGRAAIVGTVRFASGQTRLRVDASTTMSRVELNFGVLGVAPGHVIAGEYLVGSGRLELAGATGTVTIASSGIVRISTGSVGSRTVYLGQMTLINNGLVAFAGESSSIVGRIEAASFQTGSTGSMSLSGFASATFTITAMDGRLGPVNRGNNVSFVILGGNYTIDESIALAGSGGRMELGGTWTNTANLTVGSSMTLRFNGAWRNQGTVSVSSGQLELGGVFRTSDIGTILGGAQRQITILGTLDNTGAVFDLAGSNVRWSLGLGSSLPGSIIGGTLLSRAGLELQVSSAAGNVLRDVTVQGDFLLDQFDPSLRIEGSTSFTRLVVRDDARVALAGGGRFSWPVAFEPPFSIALDIHSIEAGGSVILGQGFAVSTNRATQTSTIRFGQTFPFSAVTAVVNEADFTVPAGVVFTTSAETTFRNEASGAVAVGGGSFSAGIVQGSIDGFSVPASGSTLSLLGGEYTRTSPLVFDNFPTVRLGGTAVLNGLITLVSGTVTVNRATISTGEIVVRGGSLNLVGNMTIASIANIRRAPDAVPTAAITIGGSVDLGGGSYTFTGATGSWTLGNSANAGGFRNGTLNFEDGTFLGVGANANNIINSVVVNGETRFVAEFARLRASGTTNLGVVRMVANGGLLALPAGYVLGADIINETGSGSVTSIAINGAAGTLTVPEGRAIRHQPSSGGTISIGTTGTDFGAMTLINRGLIAIEARNATVNVLARFELDAGTGAFRVSSGTNVTLSNFWGDVSQIEYSGTTTALNVSAGTYTFSRELDVEDRTMNFSGVTSLPPSVTLRSGSLLFRGTWAGAAPITVLGGTMTFDGTWSRSGITQVSAGVLRLLGTYSLAELERITAPPAEGWTGQVVIGATVDNTGRVTTLPVTIVIESGGITGGTINFAPGAGLVTRSSTVELVDVQINGDVTVAVSSVRIVGGTRFQVLRLANAGSAVNFAPGYVLRDTVLSEGIEGERRVDVTAAGTLTIGQTGRIVAVGGTASLSVGQRTGTTAMTLVNEGTIAAEALGQRVQFTVAGLSNAATGRIRVGNSGILSIENFSGVMDGISVGRFGSLTILSGTYSITSPIVAGNESYSFNGTITVAAPVTVNAGTMGLTGTVAVNAPITLNGGSLVLTGTVTAGAPIAVNGGSLTIGGGPVTQSLLNQLVRGGGGTAGEISMIGTINNDGVVLTLPQAAGNLRLGNATTAGTIRFGTIIIPAGQFLRTSAAGGNSLFGIEVIGELRLDEPNARLQITGATRFQTIRLSAAGAAVALPAGYSLTGDIIADGSEGVRSIELGATGTLTIPENRRISTAAGSAASLDIGSTRFVSGQMSMINLGSIVSSASGRSVRFVGTRFETAFIPTQMLRAENGGSIVLSNVAGAVANYTIVGANSSIDLASGTYNFPVGLTHSEGTLTLRGAWTNSGTISLLGGTLNFGTGTTTTGIGLFSRGQSGTAGAVNIVGTLTNTSSTLTLNAATGTWTLGAEGSPGRIVGGTVRQTSPGTLNFGPANNTLDGVTLIGELALTIPNGRVQLGAGTTYNSVRLAAPGASLALGPNTTISGTVTVQGAAQGTAYIEASTAPSLTVGSSGAIRVMAGSALGVSISSRWFGLPFSSIVNNGVIALDAPVENDVNVAGTFTNNGALTVGDGARMNVVAVSITNIVSGVLSGGVWSVVGSGVLNLNRAVTVNNANVTLGGLGSSPSFAGLNTNNGTLAFRAVAGAGSGTFTIVPTVGTFTNNGTLLVGAASRLAITGAFVQASGGAMVVEVGGTGTGQFGRLSVTGAATVGGAVTLTLLNNFALTRYDRFDFISAASVAGRFGSVTFPTRIDGDSKQLMLYGATGVSYVESHVADFNSNGIVDFFDYLDFLSVFEQNGDGADFDGNGTIDFFDYLDFLEKFDRA